jgi:hypothetical protein
MTSKFYVIFNHRLFKALVVDVESEYSEGLLHKKSEG